MKKIIFLFVFSSACLGVGKGWYWIKDGFSPRRLQGWRQAVSGVRQNKEAYAAKQQRFYYLGRGRQCFAFVSEDGNYVIKFPRADQFQIPLWRRALSLKGLNSHLANKVLQESFLLESFRISYDELKDATAVIGMNLSFHEEGIEKSIAIIDRIGRQYALPLDRIYYVLQYKKRMFKDVYREAIATENDAEIERVFDWLIQAVVTRAKKGILNKDHSFLHNFGYDEKQAYQIDIGGFYQSQFPFQETYVKSIEQSMRPVRKWIAKENPRWLPKLDQKLSALYTQ